MAEEHARRRLAAILAADVVGYSRLMEQDEAGTLELLKARRRTVLQPIVSQHEGRIFKITGDGVLVEFASAVNAVRCAISLQTSMAASNGDLPSERQILLRIGVSLGDVIVEGSDLYGDGVNVAARLEALAEPGGIVVSGTAFDHVRNKIRHPSTISDCRRSRISPSLCAFTVCRARRRGPESQRRGPQPTGRRSPCCLSRI
jgi:class 3 adenylate cyclase